MSGLLSKNEYVAIAAKIKFPVEPYIDGEFQQSKAGNVMETINPANDPRSIYRNQNTLD